MGGDGLLSHGSCIRELWTKAVTETAEKQLEHENKMFKRQKVCVCFWKGGKVL